MNTITPPKRLIIFPSVGNNALTITSIMNAIHFPGQKESIESVLLLYDSHVEKKSKFRHLRKLIKHTNLNLSESRIPIINDLLSEKLDYTPQDGDCLVVPGLPLHLGLILELITKEIESVVGINSVYICLTKPQGNLIEWLRLRKLENGNLKIERSAHELPFKSSINWYFESVQSYERPESFLEKDLLQKIIDSESFCDDLEEWIDEHKILKLTGEKQHGFAFEKLAAACFQSNHAIHDVAVNIEFGSERKVLEVSREEDIIAIHKNGNLLYISCKFARCRNADTCRERTLKELDRLKNLHLAFSIPKERVTRVLVTTSKAAKLVPNLREGVYVTNLSGIDDLIARLE